MWIFTCETAIVPGRVTVSAVPQLVVSGPVKTVVAWPDVSMTSTSLTNGALFVSKISMDVANAG